MVNQIIKSICSITIFKELDDFERYLFSVSRITKNRDLSHRISKVVVLIKQFKSSASMLHQEVKKLKNELLFEIDSNKRGRR